MMGLVGIVWLNFAIFPVNFPVSREFVAETGSTVTASATRQSCIKRNFLSLAKNPRFCAGK